MKKKYIIMFLLLMQFSLAIAGCGRIDIQIPEEGIELELGSEFSEDISEYITAEEYDNLSIRTEEVDTTAVGVYMAPVYYKEKEIGTLQVSVVDTTAPEAEIKQNIRIENGQKITVEDCVKSLSDLSAPEAWLLIDSLQLQEQSERGTEPSMEEANLSKQMDVPGDGSYQIQVLVRDSYGNSVVYPCAFEAYTPDTEAPVITAENITVNYGQTPDYMSGVSALDNVDGDLTENIEVDSSQVNLNQAGTYSVLYSVTDKAGNRSEKEISVTVKQKAVDPVKKTEVPVYEVLEVPSSSCQDTEASTENTVESDSAAGGSQVIVQPPQQEEVPEISEPTAPLVSPSGFDSGKADELLSMVNAERQARGLGAVSVKDNLVERAKERAQSGDGNGSGVILCRGTGATSASIAIDTWKRDWPDGTWMTEAWKYAGAACYNDGGTYTWVVVFGAY